MGRVTAAIRIEPEKVDGRYGSVRCVGLDAPSELRVAFVAEEDDYCLQRRSRLLEWLASARWTFLDLRTLTKDGIDPYT
jgi:hypothetical protein